MEFFRDHLPGAPLLLLKRCGHLPQRERPRAVVRFVHNFANQLAESGSRVREAGATEAPAANRPPADYVRTDWSQSRNTATTLGSQ